MSFNPWLTGYDADDSWVTYAACKEIGVEAFFPEEDRAGTWNANTAHVRTVKSVCQSCPVRRQCLATALWYERKTARRDRAGIWGGLTGSERHRVWRGLVGRRIVTLCRADLHALPANRRSRDSCAACKAKGA